MPDKASPDEEHVRAAEVIGALCLATDLGMGFPFEHGLHRTVVAMRLADGSGSTARLPRRPTTHVCSPTRAAPRMRTSPRRSLGSR